MRKGLGVMAVVAMVLITSAFSKVDVKADTVDDLREFIGERRADSAEIIHFVRETFGLVLEEEINSELIDRLDEMNRELSMERKDRIAELEEEIKSNQKEMLDTMREDGEANKVINLLGEIEELKILLDREELKKSNTVYIDTSLYEDIESDYDFAKLMARSLENDYEIGVVGRGIKPPTEGIFKLSNAFGKYRRNDGKLGESLGVTLEALRNQETKVVSIWAGVVDSTPGGSVVIHSGPALVTIYSGLKKIKVKPGDVIEQYDELGVVDGKSMGLVIRLDNKYIDPMLVYGQTGATKYYDWVAANPHRIVELNDMSKVEDYVGSPGSGENRGSRDNRDNRKPTTDSGQATVIIVN